MCEMRIKWTISDIYFINSFYQKKFNPNKILENQNNKSAISSVTALSLWLDLVLILTLTTAPATPWWVTASINLLVVTMVVVGVVEVIWFASSLI